MLQDPVTVGTIMSEEVQSQLARIEQSQKDNSWCLLAFRTLLLRLNEALKQKDQDQRAETTQEIKTVGALLTQFEQQLKEFSVQHEKTSAKPQTQRHTNTPMRLRRGKNDGFEPDWIITLEDHIRVKVVCSAKNTITELALCYHEGELDRQTIEFDCSDRESLKNSKCLNRIFVHSHKDERNTVLQQWFVNQGVSFPNAVVLIRPQGREEHEISAISTWVQPIKEEYEIVSYVHGGASSSRENDRNQTQVKSQSSLRMKNQSGAELNITPLLSLMQWTQWLQSDFQTQEEAQKALKTIQFASIDRLEELPEDQIEESVRTDNIVGYRNLVCVPLHFDMLPAICSQEQFKTAQETMDQKNKAFLDWAKEQKIRLMKWDDLLFENPLLLVQWRNGTRFFVANSPIIQELCTLIIEKSMLKMESLERQELSRTNDESKGSEPLTVQTKRQARRL